MFIARPKACMAFGLSRKLRRRDKEPNNEDAVFSPSCGKTTLTGRPSNRHSRNMDRIQEEIQRMVVAHMLELKSKLSKDQQTKFLDLIEEAMADGSGGPCPLEERD
jgi:hypothetical protein